MTTSEAEVIVAVPRRLTSPPRTDAVFAFAHSGEAQRRSPLTAANASRRDIEKQRAATSRRHAFVPLPSCSQPALRCRREFGGRRVEKSLRDGPHIGCPRKTRSAIERQRQNGRVAQEQTACGQDVIQADAGPRDVDMAKRRSWSGRSSVPPGWQSVAI